MRSKVRFFFFNFFAQAIGDDFADSTAWSIKFKSLKHMRFRFDKKNRSSISFLPILEDTL